MSSQVAHLYARSEIKNLISSPAVVEKNSSSLIDTTFEAPARDKESPCYEASAQEGSVTLAIRRGQSLFKSIPSNISDSIYESLSGSKTAIAAAIRGTLVAKTYMPSDKVDADDLDKEETKFPSDGVLNISGESCNFHNPRKADDSDITRKLLIVLPDEETKILPATADEFHEPALADLHSDHLALRISKETETTVESSEPDLRNKSAMYFKLTNAIKRRSSEDLDDLDAEIFRDGIVPGATAVPKKANLKVVSSGSSSMPNVNVPVKTSGPMSLMRTATMLAIKSPMINLSNVVLSKNKIYSESSILLTAAKREMRANLKSRGQLKRQRLKKVHFQLPKSSQKRTNVRSLDPNMQFVQRWLKFMVLPLSYELWAFPYRLALGFPSTSFRDMYSTFYTDAVSDAFFAMDMLIALMTAVALPGREEYLTSFSQISRHYFVSVFPYDILPSIMFWISTVYCAYEFDAICPLDDGALGGRSWRCIVESQDWSLWVWRVCMVPRVVTRFLRLRAYFKSMEKNLVLRKISE